MLDIEKLCGGETWKILENAPTIDLEEGDKIKLVKTPRGADLYTGDLIKRNRPNTIWPEEKITLTADEEKD